jgi:DGQHR domain-containing protein
VARKQGDEETVSVSQVTQGKHKFYTATMFSDTLADCCTVDTRIDNPLTGFQRRLDERRADDIARYIDEDLGTIPSSIVLSAQPGAGLEYTRSKRSITFKKTGRSFLILDGQHRVFGFAKAKSKLRVPVVIYNGLTRSEECQLFIDINTNQRPVPNELLLDIKRLAEIETDEESILRDVFDLFAQDPASPLLGLMSPSSKSSGKVSRVTFNSALKSVLPIFESPSPSEIYRVLSPYLQVWAEHLAGLSGLAWIASPTLFRAIISLFADVALRVVDRHGKKFSAENYREVLKPFLDRAKVSTFKSPGTSHVSLHGSFKKALRQPFTI